MFCFRIFIWLFHSALIANKGIIQTYIQQTKIHYFAISKLYCANRHGQISSDTILAVKIPFYRKELT